jgi:hypothetical protein
MRRIAVVLAFAVLVGSACVQTVELSSAIKPARSDAGKSSEAAGVVCTPGLLAYRERARLYAFELGEPLCGALVKSVESTYRSAKRAEKPYKGQFGRVIQFYLHSSSLDVRRQPDGSVRVAYSLGVAVETCGRDLQPSARKLVTGNAVVTRRDTRTAEVVKEAAEAALQQVADNTSRLLVAGIDGPRIHDSVPAAPER